MVTLNLLPWRKQARYYQARIMKKMLSMSALCSVTVVIVIHIILSQRLARLDFKVEALKQTLQQFNQPGLQPLELEHLFTMSIIGKMDDHRDAIKRLLSALTLSMNDTSICFTEMTRQKNKIKFSGYAASAADLMSYLRNWQAASLFLDVKLTKIEQHHHAIRFYFHAIEKNSIPMDLLQKKKQDGL